MLREVRLKPEHAAEWPDLIPSVWYTAAAVAGMVTATTIVREGSAVQLRGRALTPAHFEFRGGSHRRGSWAGMKTRRTDRHANQARSA